MKLEDIGFYTLSDERALSSTMSTPLQRCELILTDSCNFNCVYCRGLRDDIAGTMELEQAKKTIKLWIDEGLTNVRFSGGEPLMFKGLIELVEMCKNGNVKHIAVSSNGSFPWRLYERLIDAGVNDFSISLDSGCCSIGEAQAGGIKGSWQKVVDNIKLLSERVYTTVGMVFTEDTVDRCVEDVEFAASLGVADIRVIPSAQFNQALSRLRDLSPELLDRFPILRYRIRNLLDGVSIRGIAENNTDRCRLVLDDMAVAKGKHFPCIIYMREGGDAIGDVGPNMRLERKQWMESHEPAKDKICSVMCLDVCTAFNKCAAR